MMLAVIFFTIFLSYLVLLIVTPRKLTKARKCFADKEYDQARALLLELLEKKPTNIAAMRLMLDAAIEAEDYQGAGAMLEVFQRSFDLKTSEAFQRKIIRNARVATRKSQRFAPCEEAEEEAEPESAA